MAFDKISRVFRRRYTSFPDSERVSNRSQYRLTREKLRGSSSDSEEENEISIYLAGKFHTRRMSRISVFAGPHGQGERDFLLYKSSIFFRKAKDLFVFCPKRGRWIFIQKLPGPFSDDTNRLVELRVAAQGQETVWVPAIETIFSRAPWAFQLDLNKNRFEMTLGKTEDSRCFFTGDICMLQRYLTETVIHSLFRIKEGGCSVNNTDSCDEFTSISGYQLRLPIFTDHLSSFQRFDFELVPSMCDDKHITALLNYNPQERKYKRLMMIRSDNETKQTKITFFCRKHLPLKLNDYTFIVKDETIYLIPLITNGTIADVLSKVFSFNLKTKVFTRHDCSICPDDLTFINRAPLRYRSIVFEEKIVKGISLATIDNNCSDTTIHCLLHLTPSFLYYCALDLNKMIWNLKWKISLPASRLPDQNGYAIGAEPIDQMTKICKRFIIDDSDHAYLFIDAKQYDDCRYIFHNFSYQEFNLLLCIDLKISNSSENPVKDPPARPFVAE